ncbi:hypothetical protein EV121DRAFT_207432 [Schizophyllum commune]
MAIFQRVLEPLDDIDVARVRYYARFVKTFKFWQSYADISVDSLQKVLVALREPLFPNLQTIDYEGPSRFTSLLPSIIGISVRELKLTYNFGRDLDTGIWNVRPEDVDYSEDRDILLAIKNRKPRAPITSLFISMSMPFTEFLRPILTGWDELEDLALEAHCMDATMFMNIAALHRLKSLDMPTVDGLEHLPAASRSARTYNDTLRSLHLYGDTVADMISILRPTSLSTLDIICGLSASAFRDMGLHIREVGVPASLQEMTLNQRVLQHQLEEEGADAYWQEALQIQHMQPFFFYRNLVEVTLVFQKISFSDDDLASLAQAWPRLQSLRFFIGHTHVPVALSSLLAFVRYCPDLKFLLLPVDATKIEIPRQLDIPCPRAHERLQVLHVQDSPIASPGMVASFLTRFFPNIRPRDGLRTRSNDAEREELWSDVRELIPILLDARMTGIHGGVRPA